MYLMLCTRVDIAFPISLLSRFQARPNAAHLSSAKRVLLYLAHTRHHALVLTGTELQPRGFCHAYWGGCLGTRRSTCGYLFSVGSAAISWQSKRQPTVALSSCEAEYMSETTAAKEAIWSRGLLAEVTRTPLLTPTVVFSNKKGALDLAHNPRFHSRSKHIDIQWNFVRERVADGTLLLQYVPIENQTADILTKALPRPVFERSRAKAGLHGASRDQVPEGEVTRCHLGLDPRSPYTGDCFLDLPV